jgi:hypothetical protein
VCIGGQYLKQILIKMKDLGWWKTYVVSAPAQQVWGPEFKSQHYSKNERAISMSY